MHVYPENLCMEEREMLEAIIFLFSLEVGYIPYDQVVTYDSCFHAEDSFYVDFDATIKFHFFFVGGGFKVYAWPSGVDSVGMPSFWPHRIDSKFTAGLQFGILSIGVRHLCAHPVTPYIQRRRITDPADGAYSEFFARFEGKVGK